MYQLFLEKYPKCSLYMKVKCIEVLEQEKLLFLHVKLEISIGKSVSVTNANYFLVKWIANSLLVLANSVLDSWTAFTQLLTGWIFHIIQTTTNKHTLKGEKWLQVFQTCPLSSIKVKLKCLEMQLFNMLTKF